MNESLYSRLAEDDGGKIVFLVMDGLGGFRSADRGSELMESAHPNLDQVAAEGICGLLDPVDFGITPGSGPGHLGLFGYDPLEYEIGRGALSAAGLGFDLKPGDVAARVNICTLGNDGSITDRRAGRLPTEEAAEICAAVLAAAEIDGVEIFLEPEREHRALLVLRGDGLDPGVADTDPQTEGVPPLGVVARTEAAERTAQVVSALLETARDALDGRERGNFILLRGFDSQTSLPSFEERYRLRARAVAQYPMYIGIARLLGMDAPGPAEDLDAEVDQTLRALADYDFVFTHVKKTDSAGEDGDFEAKVRAIEEVDSVVIPRLIEARPDVIVVTGDHATPTQLAAHSWHPVPCVVLSERAGRDLVEGFDEEQCALGALGRRRSVDLFPTVMAAAGRLAKYGA